MAEIKVKDKQKFIEGMIKSAQEDAKTIVNNQILQIDRYLDDVNARVGFLDAAGGVLSALFRGAINGVVDSINGLVALGNNIANTITHVFDSEDGTNFLADLGIGTYDLLEQTMSGLSTGVIGLVADVGKAFGADDTWAFGESGALNQISDFFKTGKAGVITALSDKETQDRYLSMSPEEVINARRSPLTSYAISYQKFDQNIKSFSESVGWVKEKIVSPITFKNYFDEKLQNTEWYGPVSGAAESIGRLVPIVVFGHMGNKLGFSQTQMATLSQGYFASSVAGGALEEALGNGVSFDDAFTYALGTAASELLIENIMGIKLSDAMLVKSGGKIFQNVLEEATEEFIQGFSERGLSYYSTPEKDILPETSKDIWTRVLFSSLVGGLGGGAMSGLSLSLYSTTAESKVTSVQELEKIDVEKYGITKAQDLFKKRTENLLKTFKSDKYTTEEKNKLFNENRIVRGLIKQDAEGGYTLTSKGEAFMRGDILAKQGDITISKATHAVGGDSYGKRYKTEVKDAKGKTFKVNILDNEKVKNLSKEKQQVIDFAKRNNLDIAFVESLEGEQDVAFYNGFTTQGTIYINANSDLDMASIIVHEIHDKISSLAQSKQLTENQFKAWKEFENFVLNESEPIIETLKKDFDLSFYENITEGLDETQKQSIIAQEKVSAFIQMVFSSESILEAVFEQKTGLFKNFSRILKSKITRDAVLKKINNADLKVFENKLIEMNRLLAKVIKETESILKAQPRISDDTDLQEPNQRVYFSAKEKTKEDFISEEEKTRVEKTKTPWGVDTFPEFSKNNFFETNKMFYRNSSAIAYELVEDDYSKMLKVIKKAEKGSFLNKAYGAWKNFLNRTQTEVTIYNHLSSAVSKSLILELGKEQSLEDITKSINQVIFGTLDYIDTNLKADINKRKGNPEGFLYTRALHGYLRDLKNIETFNENEYKTFNNDGRGAPYRRLMNAILNYRETNGENELLKALKNFAFMSDVEIFVDLALHEDKNDTSPASVSEVVDQWETNTLNIRELKEITGFNTNINSAMDMFTVGGVAGLFDINSWASVLNTKIIQASERQIEVKRAFDKIFMADKWASKNKKLLRDLDTDLIEIKELGLKMSKSQVISLRNMMIREKIQNKAIDEGIIKGVKTQRFEDGNEIDILKIIDNREKKMDLRQIGKIKNADNLLVELDNIIQSDAFMLEYNTKNLLFFDACYDFINERYKEVNGLVLRNFGRELKKRLKEMDRNEVSNFLSDLPEGINIDNIQYIYTPFLSDNSSYFKADKLEFKAIMDLGVFDGMTQDLTNTNARTSVESSNLVINKYLNETANYYGVHRVMRDLDYLVNTPLKDKKQVTYINGYIPKNVMSFYTNLLLDMAGYKPISKTPGFKKFFSFIKRNFYKATLGLNVKVITTQFATLNNLVIIYGNGKFDFYNKMLKNMASQHTKTNKEKIAWLLNNNNIMYDRVGKNTFEIGEATKQGFTGDTLFNEFTEKMMKGISFTDNSINFAFFLTLLETNNPETGAFYTMEEASAKVTEGILKSQSSALNITKSAILRTDNEVLKIFLKFLGEPLKLYTQLQHDVSRISLVKKLEQNKDKILEEGKKENAEVQKVLDSIVSEKEKLEKIENSKKFNDLSEKQQKEIRKSIKKREVSERKQRLIVEKTKIKVEKREFMVETLIGNKKVYETQKRNKITAIFMTISYLTMLDTLFGLVRGGFGDKDKPQDQQFAEYLANLVGKNFFNNIFSMLPGIRDAYQLLIEGYSITDIDELGSLDDLGRTLNYLIKDVFSGGDIDWGKTGRLSLGSLGQLLGVPVRGLERLFTTPMLYINETVWYKYHQLIGKQSRDNIELAKAIQENNLPMIEAIIENKINARNIQVSSNVYREFVRLASKNQEVNITGVGNKVTINGEEIIMSAKQVYEFKLVYKNADYLAQKMLVSPYYRRLNDKNKKSLMTSIYNYYLRKAKQDVLGADLIPQANYFRTLSQAYAYFAKAADKLYQKQKGTR